MLTNEALDILALRPGASAVEIKGAYRDLVKVWHPDRFGSDPRLREKAEDKLKHINEAYQLMLQLRPFLLCRLRERQRVPGRVLSLESCRCTAFRRRIPVVRSRLVRRRFR